MGYILHTLRLSVQYLVAEGGCGNKVAIMLSAMLMDTLRKCRNEVVDGCYRYSIFARSTLRDTI